MMASNPLKLSINVLKQRQGHVFARFQISEIRSASISSRAMKTEEELKIKEQYKPKPWPYKERGYSNLHALFDGVRKRFDENTKVIVIDGPPAVGKTEIAKKVAEELEMVYFPRATMDAYYINHYGYDLRQLDDKLPPDARSFDEKRFFKEPKHKYATALQFIMYNLKFEQYVDALAHVLNTGEGVVLERSVYGDHAFVEAMYRCGYISSAAKQVYYRMRDNTISELMRPHLIVYLDAPVNVTLNKLKQRGHGEESTINKDFLEALDEAHKQFYLKTITEHAELLMYDWGEVGDSEVVVEDIERVDFDNYDTTSTKSEDWSTEFDFDLREKRWEYTNKKYTMLQKLHQVDGYTDIPGLIMDIDSKIIKERVYDEAPGEKYAPGFNADLGDKNVLFKSMKQVFFRKLLEYERIQRS